MTLYIFSVRDSAHLKCNMLSTHMEPFSGATMFKILTAFVQIEEKLTVTVIPVNEMGPLVSKFHTVWCVSASYQPTAEIHQRALLVQASHTVLTGRVTHGTSVPQSW